MLQFLLHVDQINAGLVNKRDINNATVLKPLTCHVHFYCSNSTLFLYQKRQDCSEISLHSHGQQGDADNNQVQDVERITAERPLV